MGRDHSVRREVEEFPVLGSFGPLPARADVYLARRMPYWSRTRIQRLFRDRLVLVQSRPIAAGSRLRGGETVVVLLEQDREWVEPGTIPLRILHEDEHVLALDKAPGVVMHPVGRTTSGTLLNALHHHFAGRGSRLRPVLLHRLDKDTSGIVIVAKDAESHRLLQHAFIRRDLDKVYLAICDGMPDPPEGWRDRALFQDRTCSPHRMREAAAGAEGALSALTRYTVLATGGGRSLLGVKIFTGRQHQIRAHLSGLGHPLCGDLVYGGSAGPARQALHSYYLRFTHPATGRPLELIAPLPEDLRGHLEGLRVSGSHASTWDTCCRERPWNPRTWLDSSRSPGGAGGPAGPDGVAW